MKTSTLHMIVFSVFRQDQNTQVNFRNHMLVSELLHADLLSFKELVGSYKGTLENSYMVFIPFERLPLAMEKIRKIAERYGQESMLYIDNENKAELLYLNGHVEKLGRFTSVPREEALKHESFSLDLSTDTYYITE